MDVKEKLVELPGEHLHPIDAYEGLKGKYLVFKADTGAKVDNCFVLRPDKDTAAVEALRAYANATDNKTLAEDIYSWVGKGEPVQAWISVKDRLPHAEYGESDEVLTVDEHGIIDVLYFDGSCWCHPTGEVRYKGTKITHWMPLPQPPKGE